MKYLRWNLWGAIIVAIASVLIICEPARAVNLRGRVDAQNPFSRQTLPLPGARVDLWYQGQLVRTTITGPDGFYYFNSGTGDHEIVVNGQVRVHVSIQNQPWQDIPPILAR